MENESVISTDVTETWNVYLESKKPLRDTVCLLLIKGDKIALENYITGCWLPFKTRESDEDFVEVAEKLLKQYFPLKSDLHVLHSAQIHYARGDHKVNRLTFFIDIKQDVQCKKDLEWFTHDEIKQVKSNLMGPEPLTFGAQLQEIRTGSFTDKLALYECSGMISSPLKEGSDMQRMCIENLFKSSLMGMKEQILMFLEFIYKCYPCVTMNFRIFKDFLMALGIQDENYQSALFRAFDVSGSCHLRYRDFIIGLSAFSPVTQHGGPAGEMRCRYIFRLYDHDSDSLLDSQELRNMISDILRAKGIPTDESKLEENVQTTIQIFELNAGERLSLGKFLNAVGQLKFRGTSALFRSPKPVCSVISKENSMLSSIIAEPPTAKKSRMKDSSPASSMNDTSGSYEVGMDYELAIHSVKVKRSGTLVDVNSLWDLVGTAAVSKSAKLPPKTARVMSVDAFNPTFHANEMLHCLRFFELRIKNSENSSGTHHQSQKEPLTWGEVDMKALGHCYMVICRMTQEILEKESRLVSVNSPAYILGDIHGNYEDLVCFEKTLWRLGMPLTPASFVFLGDYVDRGSYGVEVIGYLFCQKILAPEKVILLRGNHEIRSVQDMFTFHKECLNKFGNQLGEEVWQAINECFDTMPISAVIDDKIFCVHGGIPPPWLGEGKIESIKTIPCPLPDPEDASLLAWELMWSDPISHEEEEDGGDMLKLRENEGFMANVKRGTAHCFSSEALENFLTRNGLSYVIRAHEVQQSGFRLQHKGKLLTVFSSSRYCGGSNEAACILADRAKLRFVRLNTS